MTTPEFEVLMPAHYQMIFIDRQPQRALREAAVYFA